MISCQLAVIGAGSAGCGAALAASRLGIDTILVENYQRIGGTSTFAGVNCYEPVAGATGISRRIFQEMQRNDSAGVGIYRITRHCMIPDETAHPFPGSEQRIDPAGRYEDTLRSHMEEQEFSRALRLRRGIIFEPELFCRTVEGLLAQSGCCRLRTGVAPAAVECRDGVLRRMVLTDGTRLEAARWIDCSGAVAAQCGCRMLFGQEASGRYGESGAPKFPEPVLNGVSQIFRIRPAADDAVEPLPAGIPAGCWWAAQFPMACITEYPNGDFNCNMLPTMSGLEFYAFEAGAVSAELKRRVYAFWHYLQTTFPEFRRFRLHHIFPRPGCRDGYRVLCRRMLTERDILGGLARQKRDEIIALCDHPLDFHGRGGGGRSGLLYGIPYHSLVPAGMKNLLAAGRMAGFSALAASSCRLSRTMLQLGEAAGTAAYLSLERREDFPELPPGVVRELLQDGGVEF